MRIFSDSAFDFITGKRPPKKSNDIIEEIKQRARNETAKERLHEFLASAQYQKFKIVALLMSDSKVIISFLGKHYDTKEGIFATADQKELMACFSSTNAIQYCLNREGRITVNNKNDLYPVTLGGAVEGGGSYSFYIFQHDLTTDAIRGWIDGEEFL